MSDIKREKAERLRERVISGPGVATAAERQATEVTDQDVEALRAAGFSDERIFELTVAAATGAGFRRLDAVLALLDDAS